MACVISSRSTQRIVIYLQPVFVCSSRLLTQTVFKFRNFCAPSVLTNGSGLIFQIWSFHCLLTAVTVDLAAEYFTPGKRNYENTYKAIKERLHTYFTVVVAWDPLEMQLLNRDRPPDPYLTSYCSSLKAKESSCIAVLTWSGFFTRKQIAHLLKELSNFIEERKTLPWISMHVQGFEDSPVSWGLNEHRYFTDGDNSYTIILNPQGSKILASNLSNQRLLK